MLEEEREVACALARFEERVEGAEDRGVVLVPGDLITIGIDGMVLRSGFVGDIVGRHSGSRACWAREAGRSAFLRCHVQTRVESTRVGG